MNRPTQGAARGPAAPLLLAGVLALVPIAMPSPTAAHAIVLQSEPAAGAVLTTAPGRVVLRFNSKIEKRLSRVTLTASGGAPVPLAVASAAGGNESEPDRLVLPLQQLPPGSYVVRYKVLSADGHITEGALRFTVSGRP